MKHITKATVSAICTLALSVGLASAPNQAKADSDPFIGDIMIVGFNFCPREWALANGQLLQISQNQALYSLLGTQFGGDGRTTFALPDMRSRLTMGQGRGPGLTPRRAGQSGGNQLKVMTQNTMASHSHAVNANNLDGDRPGPGGKLLAAAPTGGSGNETIYSTAAPTVQMSANMIQTMGSGSIIDAEDPFLSLFHCIATQGIFPSRS